MAKLNVVEKLSVELAQLITAEQRAHLQIEEIRRKRAKILREIEAAATAAGGRGNRVASSRASHSVPHEVRTTSSRVPVVRNAHTPVAPSTRPGTAQTDSDKVRSFVASVDVGKEVTPEGVARATGVKSGLVSTYLSRLTGTLVERVPGTKRGRYRRIGRTTATTTTGGESAA